MSIAKLFIQKHLNICLNPPHTHAHSIDHSLTHPNCRQVLQVGDNGTVEVEIRGIKSHHREAYSDEVVGHHVPPPDWTPVELTGRGDSLVNDCFT